MKKIITLILIGLLLSGCSNNDDEADDCFLDQAVPSLHLKVVNASGANLLENGTIDPNNIRVEADYSEEPINFQFIPGNEFANPDAEIRVLDNSLMFTVPHRSTFEYIIYLEDIEETINVQFEANQTREICDITYYIPVVASYKKETLEISEVSSELNFLVIVEI
jgi:hypothetical protein